MDKIFAKINEFAEAWKTLAIWEPLNELLKTLAGALKILGEDEASEIVDQIYKYGD